MVRWLVALERVADLVAGTSADWMLVGSAASAVHGVDLQPGDVDILAHTAADVFEVAAVLPAAEAAATDRETDPQTFLSSRSQPVITFGEWTLGRWLVDGEKVEVAHIAGDDGLLQETGGSEIWRHRQWMPWQGYQLPIVPLEVQLATMLSRGLTVRSRAAVARLRERGHDRALLAKALSDKALDSSGLELM